MSYCLAARGHPIHAPYHDTEYGFPLASDDALFERLVLEINQAGLSWLTILRKRDAFRAAYNAFSVDRVAEYGDAERARLMHDAGIVRNRLKVNAAIENARRIRALRDTHGGFDAWLRAHLREEGGEVRDRESWRRLFKRTFVFTGGEIVNEFLVSTGYVPGAHEDSCPVHAEVLRAGPAWRDVIPMPRRA
jgi:DNA-3-methyladenine glycosylase I